MNKWLSLLALAALLTGCSANPIESPSATPSWVVASPTELPTSSRLTSPSPAVIPKPLPTFEAPKVDMEALLANVDTCAQAQQGTFDKAAGVVTLPPNDNTAPINVLLACLNPDDAPTVKDTFKDHYTFTLGDDYNLTVNIAGQPTPTAAPSTSQAPTSSQQAALGAANPQPPAPPAPATTSLQGLRVAIDPGHNGGNFKNAKAIAKQVPDGRGGKKNCNTTGTATNSGYRESTFNLAVAKQLEAKLNAQGAVVTMTRTNDTGVGPCVDARGNAGDNADVLVSIHANGSDNTAKRGWFILYSGAPLNPAQGEPSVRLAHHVANTLNEQGFATNPDGPFTPRNDIATINHSGAPVIMLELLEMKNPEDAKLAQSNDAHAKYAQAIVDGLQRWVAQGE